MSRLIRSTDKGGKVSNASASGSLPQSKVVVLIKACQSISSDIVQDEFSEFLVSYDNMLDEAIDKARSNQQVQDLMDSQRDFRRSKNAVSKLFCFSLVQGFNKFSRKELNTRLEDPEKQSEKSLTSLSLIDDETLNESIALSSVLLKTQIHCKEAMWLLNNRFSVLNDGEPVKSHNNPISPVQFCIAFKHAIADVDLNPEAKSLAYTEFTSHIAHLCDVVIKTANEYLKEQGVLPYLSYSHSHRAAKSSPTSAPITSAPMNPFEVPPVVTPEQSAINQENMMNAIRGLQEAASLQLPIAADYVENVRILDVLKQIQMGSVKGFELANTSYEKGAALEIQPQTIAQQRKALVSQLNLTDQRRLDNTSSETIDLVGRVFSFMLSDDALPNQIKALLSHLHTPFLKIAFVDMQFFEQVEHPARELIDNLTEAGANAVDENEIIDVKMYEKIKETVNKIITEFDSDLRFVTQVLIDFKRYVKSVKHRQALTERRTTEKIKGQEKLKAVKARVNSYIQSAIASREIPSAVLIFLLQPWSDYLSFVLLRHGDESDQWLDAKKVVDDLLWAIYTHEAEHEKEAQRKMQMTLNRRVNTGLKAIAYDQAQSQKFLDAVNFIITHAIKNRTTLPASDEIREKIEKNAAHKAGNISAKDQPLTEDVKKMIDNLKFLEFGSWFEFKDGRRLKLAWYNKRMNNYLFVDQTGRKVDMISNVDMAKGLISKDIQLVPGSSKPFFERALESIYQQLNLEHNKGNA